MENESRYLDTPEHLAEALGEQGASPDEIRDLWPAVMQLGEWQAPAPTEPDTAHLIAQLRPFVPTISPVRQALHSHRKGLWIDLTRTLKLARSQISILGPSFWLLSAAVTLLGAVLILAKANVNNTLILLALGPLLSYLGTVSVFRGAGLNVMEIELTCPPSPKQLTLARLVIVLCYDLLLGIVLSLLLWTYGNEGLVTLVFHWFAPLLLVAGVALLLSLRIAIQPAAGIAYGSWLGVLLLAWVIGDARSMTAIFSLRSELGLGVIGLVCLAIAVHHAGNATARRLPHQP